MKISEIKKKMMEWEDFYGADIFQKDFIQKAKNKKELADILITYSKHMEDRERDARSHFEQFRRSLNLE